MIMYFIPSLLWSAGEIDRQGDATHTLVGPSAAAELIGPRMALAASPGVAAMRSSSLRVAGAERQPASGDVATATGAAGPSMMDAGSKGRRQQLT